MTWKKPTETAEIAYSNAAIADATNLQSFLDKIVTINFNLITETKKYVHPTDTDKYNTFEAALASVTDNDYRHRYSIQGYGGTYNEVNLVLKDYVDIVGGLSGSSDPTIIHYEASVGNNMQYDILKSNSRSYPGTPYNGDIPAALHCNIRDITLSGYDINYPIHLDFNSSPDFDVTVDNCNLINYGSKGATTSYGYALGIGEYGGQSIKVKNSKLQAAYYAGTQLSGFVWHSRDTQTSPCKFTLESCRNFGGNFGGRLVSYNSGQNDIVELKGNAFHGNDGSLLFINNPTSTKWWPKVFAYHNDITRVKYAFSTYNTELRLVSEGYSRKYKAGGTFTEGGVMILGDEYGNTVVQADTSVQYRTVVGIALNSGGTGDDCIVQCAGIAEVLSNTAMSAQQMIATSTTNAGYCQSTTDPQYMFGTAVVSTTDAQNAVVLLRNIS